VIQELVARDGQLSPEQHGQQAAKNEEHHGHQHETQADDRVIDRRQPSQARRGREQPGQFTAVTVITGCPFGLFVHCASR
jgi:hypothetical protein